MKKRDMETHLSVLGWLYLIENAFALVIGVLSLIFFAGIGFFAGVDSGDPIAFTILATVGIVGLLFFAVIALPGLLAGYGLLQRYAWARILALVLGFFKLVSFPIGTIVGVYTFWVLLQPDIDDYFTAGKEPKAKTGFAV